MGTGKERPNWIEVCTLIVVVLGMLGGGVKFFAYDRHISEVRTKLAELEVHEASEFNLQIIAQIESSDSPTIGEVRSVPLRVLLKNSGRSPVIVKEVTVDAYRRAIDDPWKTWLKQKWANKRPPFNQTAKREGPLSLDLTIIGPNSGKWTAFGLDQTVYLPASDNEGEIRKSQSRNFVLHFLIADGSEPEIVRFEIRVKTSSGDQTAIAWTGTGPFPDSHGHVAPASYTAYQPYHYPLWDSTPLRLVPSEKK